VRSGAVDVLVIDRSQHWCRAPNSKARWAMRCALQARLMSQALRKLTASINKSNTMVIFINQIG
jgi:recombination protein RecA